MIESGVTTAVDLGPWRSAVNWGFAQAELGRPARGWDVHQAMEEWAAEQRALSTRQRMVREPTTARYVQRIVSLGLRASGVRLLRIAVLLVLALFGMRAATVGGCQPGDARFVRSGAFVFKFRCVKKWPALREHPQDRVRECPADPEHPRAQVLRVLRRAYRADRDFVCTCLRQEMPRVRMSHEQLLRRLETGAATQITRWMRELVPQPDQYGVRMVGGSVLASHSWRIMFSSACEAVPYAAERVQRDAFWRAAESRAPYIRPFAYSQYLALLYDHLA